MAIHRLSARFIETTTTPGRYLDGRGLFLSVRSATSKSWLFRFRWPGKGKTKRGSHKEHEIGLGSVRDISLKEAREIVAQMRHDMALGIKPVSPRRRVHIAAAGGMTFRECVERYIDQHEKTGAWSNAKHLQQWKGSLAN
jgi:hypothetical protein